MSILFETEYQGERFVGFERPAPGTPLRLHRVAEGGLAATLAEVGSPAALPAAVAATTESITVTDAELRYLPPLASANSLVSGFMQTHRSKMDGPRPDGPVDPPKWFFKGFGSWLKLPGEPLVVPAEPVALIEEPEIVLVYANDEHGTPHYAGYTFGNDLCDIGLHRRNPAYNPYCKLCDTSIAPWLFLDAPPATVNGRVRIERDGETAWEGAFGCGLDDLYYTAGDMAEHLLSTYPAVRRPGLVNYVLLGADSASFHAGFRIADGDVVDIDFSSHGVRLDNPVEFARLPATV
ncbi:MAG: fumarylacetoacetate (FAA) hydrolase [Saccharothrix sp.]|nr:fumarylacetoacetate (FAA) hydrolase [Saccharothrix sp.]